MPLLKLKQILLEAADLCCQPTSLMHVAQFSCRYATGEEFPGQRSPEFLSFSFIILAIPIIPYYPYEMFLFGAMHGS